MDDFLCALLSKLVEYVSSIVNARVSACDDSSPASDSPTTAEQKEQMEANFKKIIAMIDLFVAQFPPVPTGNKTLVPHSALLKETENSELSTRLLGSAIEPSIKPQKCGGKIKKCGGNKLKIKKCGGNKLKIFAVSEPKIKKSKIPRKPEPKIQESKIPRKPRRDWSKTGLNKVFRAILKDENVVNYKIFPSILHAKMVSKPEVQKLVPPLELDEVRNKLRNSKKKLGNEGGSQNDSNDTLNEEDARSIVAFPIPTVVPKEEIKSFFTQHGKVSSVKLPCDVDDDRFTDGCVLIEFSTQEEAKKVLNLQHLVFRDQEIILRAMNNFDLQRENQEAESQNVLAVANQKNKIEPSKSEVTAVVKFELKTSSSEVGGDLNSVSLEDLQAVFGQYGTVKSLDFKVGEDSGQVIFEKLEAAQEDVWASVMDSGLIVTSSFIATLQPL